MGKTKTKRFGACAGSAHARASGMITTKKASKAEGGEQRDYYVLDGTRKRAQARGCNLESFARLQGKPARNPLYAIRRVGHDIAQDDDGQLKLKKTAAGQ